jgi:hypothetical protein
MSHNIGLILGLILSVLTVIYVTGLPLRPRDYGPHGLLQAIRKRE